MKRYAYVVDVYSHTAEPKNLAMDKYFVEVAGANCGQDTNGEGVSH